MGPSSLPLSLVAVSRAVSKWNDDEPASSSLSNSDLRFRLSGDNAVLAADDLRLDLRGVVGTSSSSSSDSSLYAATRDFLSSLIFSSATRKCFFVSGFAAEEELAVRARRSISFVDSSTFPFKVESTTAST